MHPVLFELGPLTVHTYGVLMAVGLVCGCLLAKYLARWQGIDVDAFERLLIYTCIIGYLGTRFLFVLVTLGETSLNPVALAEQFTKGLVWYGGPLCAFPFFVWYAGRHRIPVWRGLDCTAAGAALGHGIGRIGCFFAGCCHGSPTDSFLGVRFMGGLVAPHLRGVAVHPTQLYEAAGLFLISALLVRRAKRQHFPGEIFLLYATCYPLLRTLIEEFRGDAIRGFVFGGLLSVSQAISLFVFVVAFSALTGLKWREARNPSS